MTRALPLLLTTLLVPPLLSTGAEARSVTAAQLSTAPYGTLPIRGNRPEWDIYNDNQPGGSPWSGIVGYPGPGGTSASDRRIGRAYRRF